MARIVAIGMAALLVAGSAQFAGATQAPAAPETRRAFFGEMHLHTGYSFDAYALMGSRAEPEMAWRFARGEAVTYLGKTVRRPYPLDFMALTDHSEYLGSSLRGLKDPASAFSKSKAGALMLSDPLGAALGQLVGALASDPASAQAMKEVMADAWAHQVALVERFNEPGRFTAFPAYEWTTMLDGKYNLHRNVIFRDAAPDKPFSAADSNRPEALWAWLDAQRAKGVEGLAIPHNSNASGGLMFGWNMSNGKPIDLAYAQTRAMNEPLAEIYQHKGQSETSPLLSPEDSFADFERAEELLTYGPSEVRGSFVREALGRGLVVERRIGANPFKLGFVGASDFHNGLSDTRESAYAGVGLSSSNPESDMPDRALAQEILGQGDRPPLGAKEMLEQSRSMKRDPEALRRTAAKLNWSGGGLTGVWAEENTRASIYAALRRKETFATSGTRLKLRFFGGWGLDKLSPDKPGWVSEAYRLGVPMGGELARQKGSRVPPRFLLEAARDPDGANLDRVQVIKLWLDGGSYREKIFDVAWSMERRRDKRTGKVPAVRGTVDLKTGKYANSVGAPLLRAAWSDPEFDPAVPAVYYVRALEIPTPRWPTLLAAHYGLPLPKGVSPTLQERAISSTIWYNP